MDAAILQQEIAQIESALQTKREQLNNQREQGEVLQLPHEKETLREVVTEKFSSIQQSAVPVPAPNTSGGSVSPAFRDAIQQLVTTAFTKSIDEAIKQAKASSNAALIDAFHDILVDELYNNLVERGKLSRF